MDFIQTLTWVMTSIGFLGFIFAGRKKWWAWYINLVVQIMWATYALATGQPAFLVSAVAYFIIFAFNAHRWTKEHFENKRVLQQLFAAAPGTKHLLPGGAEVTLIDVSSKHPPLPEDGMIIHNTKLDGSPAFTTPDDSNLVKHARAELERIGEDPEVIDWYCRVIREYSSFGHSGGSAHETAIVLEELLRFRPLGPLTNDPKEWIHHGKDIWGDPETNGIWQNTRDGRAFSADGGETYYIVDEPQDEKGQREMYRSACNICEGPKTNVDGKCPGCGKVYLDALT